MKLHILAIPHTVTSKKYLACAITQKVYKFIKMMNGIDDIEFIFYGHEDSEIHWEIVTCINDEVLRNANSFLWAEYGKKFFEDIRPQVLPFEQYGRQYSYKYELKRWATNVLINNKDCYGINNHFRRGANFHAWENDMHVGIFFCHRHISERCLDVSSSWNTQQAP